MVYTVHLIKKDKDQEEVERRISELIEADPSDYVSHNVSSFKVGSTTWYITALQVENLTKSEALGSESNNLTSFRKKEGLLVLGSEPNFNDGCARIMYSAVTKDQLQYSHLEAEQYNTYCSTREQLKHFYYERCLRVGSNRIHHHAPIETIPTANHYELYTSETTTTLSDQTSSGSIRGKLDISYLDPEGGNLVYNFVLPNDSVNEKFSLKMTQLKPSWCQCFLDIVVNNVKVTLLENTVFCGPLGHKYAYESQTDEQVLLDESYNVVFGSCSLSEYNGEKYFFVSPSRYKCNLPDLGATFFSDQLTRTYALKFLVRLQCVGPGRCSSTISGSIKITVPTAANPDFQMDVEKLNKIKDFVFLKRFPKAGIAIQDINQYIFKKSAFLNNHIILTHHSSVIACPDHIIAIITMSSYGLIQRGEIAGEKHRKDAFNLENVDCTDILLMPDSAFLFSPGFKHRIRWSMCLRPCGSNSHSLFRPFGENFRAALRSHPGSRSLKFEDGWSIEIHLAKKSRWVILKTLFMEIVEEVQIQDGDIIRSSLKSKVIVDREYGALQGRLTLKDGVVTIPKLLYNCGVTYLKPLILTQTCFRKTRMVVSMKLASFMAATEYIRLESNVYALGDYESLNAKPAKPPSYDSGVKEEVKDVKDQ